MTAQPARWFAGRRVARSLGPLVLALGLSTCNSDTPIGPGGRVQPGYLAFRPVYSTRGLPPGLPLDRVHVIVVRPPNDTLANTITTFSLNSNQLQLTIPVLLQQPAETLVVTLELLSGTTVLFSGTRPMEVRQGPPGTTPADSIPVAYVEPGPHVVALSISPRDTVLQLGDTLGFRVTALDVNSAPVSTFYVSWSVDSANRAAINAATGATTPIGTRTAVYVRVQTPDLPGGVPGAIDSTPLTLIPKLAQLQKVSGDSQSQRAGTRLSQPLVVKLVATDLLGVQGVPVSFTALGGGILDSAVVHTDANGLARDSLMLGPGAGTDTIQVKVSGVAQLNLLAFAQGPPAATIAAASPVTQIDTAGTTVAVRPSVLVTDSGGQPVAGVTVTFAATAGNGTVTGGVTTTNASGIATVGSWILGTALGSNTLTATAAPAGITGNPVTFTVTAIAGRPATIAPASVLAQSAGAGTAVAVPPAVLVTDANGNADSGVVVTFATVGGRGSVTGGSDTTNGSGIATVGSWTVGSVAGTDSLTATAAGTGISGNPVRFTATVSAAVPVTYTWTGATSTDWSDPANWNPTGGPPGASDHAVIPIVSQQPVLSTPVSITNLTVANGASLSLGGTVLTASGNVSADTSIITNGFLIMTGAGTTVQGTVPNLFITLPNATDAVTVAAALTATNNLTVNAGRLVAGGHAVSVSGNLATDSIGVLVMTNPADTVAVSGSATFGGEDETGLMSAGTLQLQGSLTQNVGVTQNSLVATGTHKVILDGTSGQVIRFNAPGQSRLQDLELASIGGVSFFSPATISGQLSEQLSSTLSITSAGGFTVSVGGLAMDSVDLGGVVLDVGAGNITQFDNVRFVNYPETAIALRISRPSGVFTFRNLIFGNTSAGGPPTTGFYIEANDTDGATSGVLTIDLVNPIPATDGGFSQALNGAVINWPAARPVKVWAGTISTDWSNPGNWSPAGVPDSLDAVSIAPTTNQPTLTASSVAGGVTIAGLGARLTIAGHTLTMGTLVTHTDGLLVMTNPADVVVVTADAAFQGGDETLSLSAGELRLAGNFTQQVQTSPASFRASGTHRTVLNGAVLQSVSFCCGAGAPSGFQELDISNSAGINIQNGGFGVFVYDTLIAQVGAGPAPQIYMLGTPMTAARFRVDKLIVDRGTLTLNEGGVPANQQFDNVTFQNYQTSQTQLAIVAPGGAAGPRTLTFSNLLFQPLTTGNTGRYLNVTAPSGTLIVDLPGASPAGGNGPAFTTTSGAVTVNWPAAPGITWTGTTSTDWNDSTNWSGGGVPTASDDVTIPAGGNQPVLLASVVARDLTIQAGAVVDLNSWDMNLSGSLAANATPSFLPGAGGRVQLQGTGRTVTGDVGSAELGVYGSYSLSGATAAGDLFISGTGTLTVNGKALTMTGGLFTYGPGVQLIMINPADLVTVAGTATFDGGVTFGSLTAGVLRVGGNFLVTTNWTQTAFQPTLAHRVVLTNTVSSQSVNMGTVTANFQDLELVPSGSMSMPNNVRVDGRLITTGGVAQAPAVIGELVAGGGGILSTLTVAGVDVDGLLVSQAPLLIGNGTITRFQNVSFSGQDSTVTQLTIDNAGGATPFSFTGLSFAVTPTTGHYLVANDFDGASPDPLTINMVSASPAAPSPSLFSATNGAVINWPAAVPVITWTGGGIPTDWFDPANWSPGAVPTIQDTVVIPAAGNQPVLTNPANAAALSITGGSLTLNGQFLLVAGDFSTSGTGLLVMTNPFDQLQVIGDATFNGGNELDSLSAGTLIVNRNLTQLAGTDPNSFHASGTHRTELNGNSLTVSFETPASSRFQDLSWFGLATLTLATDVVAQGKFTPDSCGDDCPAGTVAGSGQTLTVGDISSAGVTFDNVKLAIDQSLPTAPFIDAVVFQNLPTSATQLTILHPGSVSPVVVSNVTFMPLTTGNTGLYIDATDRDGPSPDQLIVTVQSNDPSNGPAFTKQTNGAQVNWPVPTTRTWTGAAVTTDWFNGNNWSGFIAPIPRDTVVIDFATTEPVLTGPVTVAALSIAGGNLTVNAQSVQVNGDFSTSGTGVLIMTDPADNVTVAGNATFNGGLELGFLDQGVLTIGGNLTQLATTDPNSFHTSGAHLTVFTANSPTLDFATPGNFPGTSHFEQFRWTGTGTLTLASDVFAHGVMDGAPAVVGTIASTGHKLQVGDLAASGVTFDHTPLVIDHQSGLTFILNNVTFQNMDPTATQLTFNHPGDVGPLPLNNVTFNTVPSTGLYLSANDLTPTDAQVLTLDMVNPSPVTPGNFVQVSGGAAVNWAGVMISSINTWLGGSTDWFTPGNWSLGRVPGRPDSVLIPATASQPTLTADTAIARALNISGGNLILNGHLLQVTGNFATSGTGIVTMTNPADALLVGSTGAGNAGFGGGASSLTAGVLVVAGNLNQTSGTSALSFAASGTHKTRLIGGSPYTVQFASPGAAASHFQDLDIAGSASGSLLSGAVALDSVTILNNSSAAFSLNGHTLRVGGAFSTSGTGRVQMTNSLDSLLIAGSATFDGGNETGKLIAGAITLVGNFTQTATNSSLSYAASGTHGTILAGTGVQTVSFATPGLAASRLNNPIVANSAGGITFVTDVAVAGPNGGFAPGVPRILHGTGTTVIPLDLGADSLTLDNLLFAYDAANGGAINGLHRVTFQNYAPTATPLTISHPGAATPFTFDSLSFLVTPTTGHYLSATDQNPADGQALTLNLVAPSPALPDSFVRVAGGAVVNWAGVVISSVNRWKGTTSPDWNDGTNWSSGVVPTFADNALIPAAAATQPILNTAGPGVNDLTVEAGASLTIADTAGLVAIGNVDASGTISSGTGVIVLSGTGKTVKGNLPNVTIGGSYSLDSNVTLGSGNSLTVNGSLTLAGRSATAPNFFTSNSGLLVMNTLTDSLIVSGSIFFGGGSESGRLTNGVIVAQGDFIQDTTSSPLSFAASAGHKVVFTGSTPQTVTFLSAGLGSQFGALEVNGAGGVSLGSNVVASGGVTVTQGSLDPGGNTLTDQGSFVTSGTGTLTMQSSTDSVLVSGNATFNGGDESALLTAGVLRVAGNFSQVGSFASTFAATGTHRVIMNGGTQTISAPGVIFNTFSNLTIASTGNVSFLTSALGGGDFSVTTPVVVDFPAGLFFDGNITSVTGSALQGTQLIVRKTLSVGGIFAVDTTTFEPFSGVGTIPVLPYTNVAVTGNATLAPGNQTVTGDLVVSGGGSFPLAGRLVVGGNTIFSNSGTNLSFGGNTLVTGLFAVNNSATLSMTNNVDSLVATSGTALNSFDAGIGAVLSAGVIRLAGSFTQGGSSTGFPASGIHKTVFDGTGPQNIDFTNPGIALSRFQDLDISPAKGLVSLNTDIFANGSLISLVGAAAAPVISGGGKTLTAVRFQVDKLNLSETRMVLSEGAGTAEQFDNVNFNFASPAGLTQLTVTGPGGAAGPRNITFNGVNFQGASVGTGALYVNLTSTNSLGLNLTMANSNQGQIAVGNGLLLSNPPNQTVVSGATIFWP